MKEQLDRIESKLDLLLAKKKTVKRKPVEYGHGFEQIWYKYPSRLGGNPKIKALSAYNARVYESEDNADTVFHEVFHGVKRYASFCDDTNKTGTEFVMQACRFFGPDKFYLEKWEIPAEEIHLPHEDSGLEAFAVLHGLHEKGSAPTHIRTNYEYRQWIKGKL